MKKFLLSSAAVILTAGAASADVALSGEATMGMFYDGSDWMFDSGIDLTFNLSAVGNNGLSFGATFDAADAGAAASGTAGTVWMSGAFGKLTMGDIDHADEVAVGDLAGVGLTGLYDLNEINYDNSNTGRPALLYSYSMNQMAFHASVGQDGGGFEVWGLGMTYTHGAYTFALGYGVDSDDDRQITVGVTAELGDTTLKAIYADWESGSTQWYGASVEHQMGALGLSAFVQDPGFSSPTIYGLGMSYDLGGGAALKAGVVDDGYGTYADFGIAMTF